MGLGLGLNLSAGYTPSWEPSELSSLLHWYRLGVGQISDDDGVTGWRDQKGSNNHAVTLTTKLFHFSVMVLSASCVMIYCIF